MEGYRQSLANARHDRAAKLENILVPCVYLSSGALEMWSLQDSELTTFLNFHNIIGGRSVEKLQIMINFLSFVFIYYGKKK